MKRCSRCGQDRPEHEFNLDRSKRDGLQTYCWWCNAEMCLISHRAGGNGHARKREWDWAHAANAPGVAPGIRFGGAPLTYETWLLIKEITAGCCALCGRDEVWGSLHADHDYQTGEVRGALCTDCNRRAVGMYEKHGKYGSYDMEQAIRAYLADPPAARLKAQMEERVGGIIIDGSKN
jgi:hypothetical protein